MVASLVALMPAVSAPFVLPCSARERGPAYPTIPHMEVKVLRRRLREKSQHPYRAHICAGQTNFAHGAGGLFERRRSYVPSPPSHNRNVFHLTKSCQTLGPKGTYSRPATLLVCSEQEPVILYTSTATPGLGCSGSNVAEAPCSELSNSSKANSGETFIPIYIYCRCITPHLAGR